MWKLSLDSLRTKTMVEDTTEESVLDHDAESLLRQALRDAGVGDSEHGFDIPITDDVFLGFQPNSGYPADLVGHLYIYVPDLTHHQRTDDLGHPYTGSPEIFDQSKTLNVLANELRQILYEELNCDHTFSRDETADSAGSACYMTPVTSTATPRQSPIPDDEM